MMPIILLICLLLISVLPLEPPQMAEVLRLFLTQENHLHESNKLSSLLKGLDSQNSTQTESIIEDLHPGFSGFLLKNKHVYASGKPRLKHVISLLPSTLFDSENPEEFDLSEEFERFLEEIEETYRAEHVRDYDLRTIFSEDALNDKAVMLKVLLSKGEDKQSIEDLKAKRQKEPRKLDFVQDSHREKFKNLLDSFFEERVQGKADNLKGRFSRKLELHHSHFTQESQKHHEKLQIPFNGQDSSSFYETLNEAPIPSPEPRKSELKGNYSLLVGHIQSLEDLISQNQLRKEDLDTHLSQNSSGILLGLDHLLRIDPKISNYHSNETYAGLKSMVRAINGTERIRLGFNVSFLEVGQDFAAGLRSVESPPEGEECMGSEVKSAVSAAMEQIASAVESNEEDSDNQVQKKEVKNGKSAAEQNMQMKMVIQLIKMVINAIVSIITGFFRIIVPPGILAFFSCPEAGVFPENLINIINFDEKTDQLLQKIEAYPEFFESFSDDDTPNSQYYMCAQGLFTSECSALWPGFGFLPFLITQPPFITIPFLLFLPVLDWLQMLPGDMPMCFLCCIQVLLQCKGVKFSEIPQCGGLYNLDTLLRAIFDIALLIFLGFSMVPGLCSYWPFIINMWMIPPRLMTEEEKMLKRAPKLKALLDAVKSEGDALTAPTEKNCDKAQPSEKEEESPFGNPEDVSQVEPAPQDIPPELMGQVTDDWRHPEDAPDEWNARYVEDEYKVEHWEKNKGPEDSVRDEWERKMVASVEGEGENGGKHETQRGKIDVGNGKKTAGGEIGGLDWEYENEK